MIKAREFIEKIKTEKPQKNQNWRLKLDDNENIYGCPNSVLSVVKNFQGADISQYPKNENLLNKFEIKYHKNKNQILFTNARSEANRAFIDVYLNKEEQILAPKSLDGKFEILTNNIDANVEYFEFDSDININIAYIREKISQKTKIIFISTPDEVSGKVIRPSMLEQIIGNFKDILFVLDCTYIDYSFCVSLSDYLDLIDKFDNVAVIKSFSKAHGLAGLRFNAVFAHENIIENLKKVIANNSVNSIALGCVSMVLGDEKNIQEIKALNLKAKELFVNELEKKGFKPIESEANFILCDFLSCCDFYYKKLKNNGVITKSFPKNSPFSNCLRITIPTIGGVRYVSELLNEKEILAFEIDNVLFDTQDSYNKALVDVYKSFADKEILFEEIYEAKKINALASDIETLEFLLKKDGLDISFDEILQSYRKLFYDSKEKSSEYLIDKQNFLLSKQTLQELAKKYDLVIFSNKFKDEINYLLKKYDIFDYFCYTVAYEDIENSMFKPHPQGVKKLIEHCRFSKITYFGSDADDIIAGNLANVDTVGVVYPCCDYNKLMNNYRHLGATHILENIKYIEDFVLNLEN